MIKQGRGGKVVLISDYDGVQAAGEGCLATITMPKVHPLIAPMVWTFLPETAPKVALAATTAIAALLLLVNRIAMRC